jgi:hypothetical protein
VKVVNTWMVQLASMSIDRTRHIHDQGFWEEIHTRHLYWDMCVRYNEPMSGNAEMNERGMNITY